MFIMWSRVRHVTIIWCRAATIGSAMYRLFRKRDHQHSSDRDDTRTCYWRVQHSFFGRSPTRRRHFACSQQESSTTTSHSERGGWRHVVIVVISRSGGCCACAVLRSCCFRFASCRAALWWKIDWCSCRAELWTLALPLPNIGAAYSDAKYCPVS